MRRIFVSSSITMIDTNNFDEFIKVPKYFLIAGGFWPFQLTANPLGAKIYSFYNRFQTASYVCFIVLLVVNLIILVIKNEGETRIFSGINVFILVFETCVKILIFQVCKIPNMFHHAMLNELQIKQSKDEEIKRCYQMQTAYSRKIHVLQFLATTFSCASFAGLNLMEFYHSKDLSEYKNKPFMHDLWYPFARETHMPWVIGLNLFIVSQGTCFNTATQSTFINLMVYASCRLKILSIKLKKFPQIAKEEHDGDVVYCLKKLIVEHQDLLGFVKSLNKRTKYVMLMEFILNSICLASGTVQLVVVTTWSNLFTVSTILALELSQIFLLAWSANEITQEGLKVADAIASSNWHEQSVTVKKMFVMMYMRSHVPIGLTAGPFFRMSTNTALTTVKAAYTYLTLMLRNYE